MRTLILLTMTLLFLPACRQNNISKLTVVLLNNQNPDLQMTADTLLRTKEVDLSMTPIDLFFSWSNFHLPYYVPTDGIFKNAAKEKECNWNNYPSIVKCYKYDEKNRVVRMTVDGSGTMSNFIYSYNDKNQISDIDNRGTKFTLTYNTNGTLKELGETDGVVNKKLVFIYQ